MMTISEFLSDRIRAVVVRTVFAVAAALFLMATGTQTGIIIILGIFWVVLFFGSQIIDFLRCRSRLRELEGIMDGLDKKYLFAECVPKSKGAYERRMMDFIRRAGQAMTGAVSDAEAASREYREYVESWVHEIKAPITAAELICRNLVRELNCRGFGQESDGGDVLIVQKYQSAALEIRRKLSLELAQVEAHVERVLFYARAESPEKDFLIRQVNLGEVVAQAISQYRALLMENGIRVETVDLNQMVFTDSKWVAFILGQLLQNAVRYRRTEPVIVISAEKDLQVAECQGNVRNIGDAGNIGNVENIENIAVPRENVLRGDIRYQGNVMDTAVGGKRQIQLVIRDNGIGIPAHELPRVFERGFTGSNGRARGGSTGMGLYLCKKLADSLEIDLQIISKVGEGTAVTLAFPAK